MAMLFENFIITVILVAAVYARNKSPLLDDDSTRVVNKAAGRLPSRNHIKTYTPVDTVTKIYFSSKKYLFLFKFFHSSCFK